jgi:hypothetical protein
MYHLSSVLWGTDLDHVFHGSYLMDLGSNSLTSGDASDALLCLKREGYIEVVKFNPSPSEAAILGLSGRVYVRSAFEPPNAGNAFAFDWKVVKDWSSKGARHETNRRVQRAN